MEKISAHITYVEATHSQTAIRHRKENVPNAEQLTAMRLIAEKIFEPVRAHFKRPIAITSFFRTSSSSSVIITSGTRAGTTTIRH